MHFSSLNVMKGTAFLTDDIDFLKAVPTDIVKIISLEEHGEVKRTMPDVIIGTILLPPIEAVIAEADGDEEMYNTHYLAYMNTPAVCEFVTALIGALYRNKSLLFYVESIKDNFSVAKLMEFMWKLYGIGIGIIGSRRCEFDPRCIPIWLDLIFMANIIDAKEFVYVYPDDTWINPVAMNKLINELDPVGRTYNERVETILQYKKRVKEKPRTTMALYQMR